MNTPRTALEECLRLAELATPGPIFHGIRGDDSVWVSFGNPNNGPHAQGDCHLPPFDAAFMACAAAYLRTYGKALSEALGGWQEIETANFDGEDVWLFWEGGDPEQFVGYWSHEYDVWMYREELVQEVIGAAYPTHWRPLPPPPTSAKGSEVEGG